MPLNRVRNSPYFLEPGVLLSRFQQHGAALFSKPHESTRSHSRYKSGSSSRVKSNAKIGKQTFFSGR